MIEIPTDACKVQLETALRIAVKWAEDDHSEEQVAEMRREIDAALSSPAPAESDDAQVTVRRLIAVLTRMPPDARISYVDFTGYDNIDAYITDSGEVEIGPKVK